MTSEGGSRAVGTRLSGAGPRRCGGIVEAMNYVVCPDDGERLKAATPDRVAGQALVLRCPGCGQDFTLTAGCLARLPDEPTDPLAGWLVPGPPRSRGSHLELSRGRTAGRQITGDIDDGEVTSALKVVLLVGMGRACLAAAARGGISRGA